jgi:hypothetical protein
MLKATALMNIKPANDNQRKWLEPTLYDDFQAQEK